MDWSRYAISTLEKLEGYFFKKPSDSSSRCCISVSENMANIINVKQKDDQFELLLTDSISYDGYANAEMALLTLLNKHNFGNTPTCWLLNPKDYLILLIDSMPQDEKELESSLLWRIKNLVNFPLENAVIDYFLLPPNIHNKEKPLVAAIVAQKNHLTHMVDFLQNNGINLYKIDVPEISLHNLTAYYETNEKSNAVFYMYKNIGILNITNHKMLYFSKHLELPVQAKNQDIFNELLSLELLRLMDFFQSQWRLPAPTKLLIASSGCNDHEKAETLSKHLMMPVEILQISQHLFTDGDFNNLLNDFIPEIGSVIQEKGI